jgi:hypothetical protein
VHCNGCTRQNASFLPTSILSQLESNSCPISHIVSRHVVAPISHIVSRHVVAPFLTSCLDMYIVQPLDIVNLVLVPRIEIRVSLEAWDLFVFGWTCWISENFNGKGPNFKEMGARVCLRYAVISDTLVLEYAWNICCWTWSNKTKKTINQSTNRATHTLKQLISNTGEYQIYWCRYKSIMFLHSFVVASNSEWAKHKLHTRRNTNSILDETQTPCSTKHKLHTRRNTNSILDETQTPYSTKYVHCEVYLIQHYVIKFVNDFRQIGGFLQILRFSPPLKLTATI